MACPVSLKAHSEIALAGGMLSVIRSSNTLEHVLCSPVLNLYNLWFCIKWACARRFLKKRANLWDILLPGMALTPIRQSSHLNSTGIR